MRGCCSPLAGVMVLVGACSFDTSGIPHGDGPSSNPTLPDSPDGEPAPCLPGAPTRCNGQDIVSCPDEEVVEPCAYGCTDDPGGPRCKAISPSNDFDTGWLTGEVDGELVVGAGETVVFDTSTGGIASCAEPGDPIRPGEMGVRQGMGFYEVPRTAPSPDIGVLVLDRLVVEPGGQLAVIGRRAAGILVRQEATVRGVLSLPGGRRACSFSAACGDLSSAEWTCAGPGGFFGGLANETGRGPGGGKGGPSGGAGVPELGGGGAGFGAPGGAGGSPGAGEGGSTYGTVHLEPLLGGSGGGGGGDAEGGAGEGRGGGGALQVTALVEVLVEGSAAGVNAGGGGGQAGSGTFGEGGGGGGSGGAILLEAPSVRVLGAVLAANGGGGGSGGGGREPGEDGLLSDARASGGDPSGASGERGGDGGAGAVTAEGAQGSPTTNAVLDGTGGGGGGVGRIRLRAVLDGIELTGAVVSPPPSQGFDLAR